MFMIIDGRKIADRILEEVKEKLRKSGKSLRLAAVLVGENPELEKFVQLKAKAAEKIGVAFPVYQFLKEIEADELVKRVREVLSFNDGVLVELPLPQHIDQQAVLNEIPEEKDVDVLSQKSQEKFFSGKSKVLPPSVEAVKQIFEEYKIDPKGKTAVVFGQGILVGKPVSHWLANQGAKVSIIIEHTKEPAEISKYADIVISGVGQADLITADMVKDGAVAIDFGKDVDFEEVSQKAGLITPPTGGVGPIVVAAVLKNFVELNS